MATLFEHAPNDVKQNIRFLCNDLDEKIPAKSLDKNLLIATWNIRAFGGLTRKYKSVSGDSPKRDQHSLMCIVEIIRRFDVIAVQEVKSNIRALRDTMLELGSDWSLILTDVAKGSAGNGERMAYIFDTRRVQLSGLACELVVPKEWYDDIDADALNEQFVRTPYAVSFKSGSRTFILVTLHIIYGDTSKDRIKELKGIAKWLSDWAGNVNAYHHNLITLGDFNIDARGDLLDQTFLSEGLFIPDALQKPEVTRSIFNETKYYDQIAWFDDNENVPKMTLEFVKAGSYDFVKTALKNRNLTKLSLSWMLSDHYPLWAEFKI